MLYMLLTCSNMMEYPLNDAQMRVLNPDSELILYNSLNSVHDIDDLFTHCDKLIILYLLHSRVEGHWTCLMKAPKGSDYDFMYFDSYGKPEDWHLDRLTRRQRAEYDEKFNVLQELLDNYKVYYNNVPLQGPDTETCGMFVTHRLHHSDLDTQEYIDEFFKDAKCSPDYIVSTYVLEMVRSDPEIKRYFSI